MFQKAQLKLTVLYSVLFLLLFWAFSYGIYFWMERSFGESYISRVNQVQQQQRGQNIGEFKDTAKTTIATIAGDVALNQLRDILLILNGIFLIIIPALSWFLAKRTLSPIKTAHQQQKQFVSDASHELRTPLSIMKGELDVSLQKKRAPKEYERILNSTREEVNRLIYLVENLLFLARIDQKQNSVQKAPVDLMDVVSTTIIKLQPKIQKKNIIIHFKPLPDSIPVLGQEVLLSQLFFNLIDNAVIYTPKKGQIWVSLENKKQYIVVSVRDSGIGFLPKHQEKIFDRFYRVDNSRSQSKGYGLGLAIAKEIVQKHKGKITVSSKENKGTLFTVTLPYI